ncbi:MAG: DUF4249 domain-containing protein [Prevotellaceae bacterium]|jgi:hypothetical protein|nr:DUF4249 domain-containing protein [Prevotellaceae bacterium]
MKSIKNTLLISAFVFLTASCTERIDISTHPEAAKLVINAMMSAEPSQQTVWISKSIPYFGGGQVQGVSDAQVRINGVLLTPDANNPGQYLTSANYSVAPGNTALLRVLYDFDGDGIPEEYTAQDVMPHKVYVDTTIIYPFGLDTGRYIPTFVIMIAAHRESLNDECASVDMYYGNRNMCRTVSDYSLDKIPYGLYGNDSYFTFNLPTGRTSRDMGDGDTLWLCPFDTINLRMGTISQAMYTYLNGAESETSGSSPMFSGPPANVKGNIQGPSAIGCFGMRNPGSWKSVVLPMNVKTLDNTWNATDGSGLQLSISKGTATYSSEPNKGKVYFSGMQVDASIRGFWAQQPTGSINPVQFQMLSYDEFVQVSTQQTWKREKKESGF